MFSCQTFLELFAKLALTIPLMPGEQHTLHYTHTIYTQYTTHTLHYTHKLIHTQYTTHTHNTLHTYNTLHTHTQYSTHTHTTHTRLPIKLQSHIESVSADSKRE